MIDHLVAAEERHGVARREIKNRAPHFLLRGGRDLDVKPERCAGAEERDDDERNTDARDADAIGTQGGQLVVGGKPAEDEEYGGKQSPRNCKDERERQDVSDEAYEVFDRQIVINQKRQELAKDVADDEDKTEDDDGEDQVHQELAAEVAIDDFHRSGLLVRFAERGKCGSRTRATILFRRAALAVLLARDAIGRLSPVCPGFAHDDCRRRSTANLAPMPRRRCAGLGREDRRSARVRAEKFANRLANARPHRSGSPGKKRSGVGPWFNPFECQSPKDRR